MHNTLFDKIEPAKELVANGFVLGGDFTEQAVGVHKIACYAAVALHNSMLSSLNACVNAVISKHLGFPGNDIEVHAVDIWNGSSRRRGAYSALDNKDRMKLFFAEFSATVGKIQPLIAVAVKCLGGELTWNNEKSDLKKLLVYSAFSRLDGNVRILLGKHLGEPKFFHDHEDESLASTYPGDPENTSRGLIDVHIVPGTDPSELLLFKAFDPVYESSDSKEHRLIQIADVAAYFVGKFLRMRAQVLIQNPLAGASRMDFVTDANFCRAMWDVLNIEAALVAFREEQRKHPIWISNVVENYDAFFDAGIDMCICSIREAVDRDGRSPGSVAIGYLNV